MISSRGAFIQEDLQDLAPAFRQEEMEIVWRRRNLVQGRGLIEALKQNPSSKLFVMVGAAHLLSFEVEGLAPVEGLLSILEKEGYRLTPL